MDVTEAGLDVWRPAVAVDGRGDVRVAWAQQVDGNWDIYHRGYTPAGKRRGTATWSEAVRVTDVAGLRLPRRRRDRLAKGVVWLAWQAFREGNYEILAAALATSTPGEPRVDLRQQGQRLEPRPSRPTRRATSTSPGTPTTRATTTCMLHAVGRRRRRTIAVADSARFEARPSLACDARGSRLDRLRGRRRAVGQGLRRPNMFRKIGLDEEPRLRPLHQPHGHGEVPGRRQAAAAGRRPADGLRRHARRATRACRAWRSTRRRRLAAAAASPAAGRRGRGLDQLRPALRRQRAGRAATPGELGEPARQPPGAGAVGDGLLVVYSGDDRTSTPGPRSGRPVRRACSPAAGPTSSRRSWSTTRRRPRRELDAGPSERDGRRGPDARLPHRASAARSCGCSAASSTATPSITAHGDGDGLLEDSWRYALDAGDLDWIGNGDHDNGGGHEYTWWQIQKMTDLYPQRRRTSSPCSPTSAASSTPTATAT